MKAHLSHRYTLGGTKAKVICQDQYQMSRSRFKKNGRRGGTLFFLAVILSNL